MRSNIWTFTDAAGLFGTDARTVSGLVKRFGIKPKKTGMPGKAKGLDRADMARLARSFDVAFDPDAVPMEASA